jgi:CHAT domain-containing protein
MPKGGGSPELPAFDAAVAYELYRLIFAPSATALKRATSVIWYGHGPLGAVPPAVLITAPPAKPLLRAPEEFAATPFLVDRYAFSVLADLSLFPWHRDRQGQREERPRFLGVGAPMLSAEEISGAPRARSYDLAGGLDGKELAELPKLAESVDELKSLAGIVGEAQSTLWLGPDASEQNFVADRLSGYRTMALATHGFLPGEIRNVPEPALMLALDLERKDRFDGILTSREIAALKLNADLVILSACNTASADGRPRAEMFTGLTQAFFMAGARTLMVSHWPVMSGAAVQLSVGTVERARGQGVALSKSLQLAMQAARKEGAASAIEAHPSYWGPFVIVGDGR